MSLFFVLTKGYTLRIDRESKANHDLILWLDEPAGIKQDHYRCKYLFSEVGRSQVGLAKCLSQGERDRLAYREAKKNGICVIGMSKSSCDWVKCGF